MSHRSGGYIRLWLITLGSILSAGAMAQSPPPPDPIHFTSIGQLRGDCKQMSVACTGYIMGVLDTMAALSEDKHYCIPGYVKVHELVQLTIGALDSPDLSSADPNRTAVSVVYYAVLKHYPCGQS